MGEAEVLPEACWPCGAVQLKDGLMTIPYDVHVGWPMVIQVDGDSKTSKPEDGRHRRSIATKALGFLSSVEAG